MVSVGSMDCVLGVRDRVGLRVAESDMDTPMADGDVDNVPVGVGEPVFRLRDEVSECVSLSEGDGETERVRVVESSPDTDRDVETIDTECDNDRDSASERLRLCETVASLVPDNDFDVELVLADTPSQQHSSTTTTCSMQACELRMTC